MASTKAFSCQLAVLACLALAFAKAQGARCPAKTRSRYVNELMALPGLIAEALKGEHATSNFVAHDHRAPARERALSRPGHELPAWRSKGR